MNGASAAQVGAAASTRPEPCRDARGKALRCLRSKTLVRLACVAAVALLGSCAQWRTPTVPLRTLAQPAPCAARPDSLLVMLPGSHSLPEEFIREGFVRAVRERRLAADVLLVDAHVGYYDNRSIIKRLRADVVEPARAKGYRRIWLVGISIGGVGAMLYADAQPDDVDGLVILAPYLGTRLTALEIRNAGSLAAWPAPLPSPESDVDVTLWRWLQAQTNPADPGKKIPLFLGYGLDDRFVYNARVLSEALPPARVFTTEGGHDWPAWNPLWRHMVEVIPIPRDATCAPAVAE